MNNTAPFNLQLANFVYKNKTTAQSDQCEINIQQETMEHSGQNTYFMFQYLLQGEESFLSSQPVL